MRGGPKLAAPDPCSLMEVNKFERVLDQLVADLSSRVTQGLVIGSSSELESLARESLQELLVSSNLELDFEPHPHVFPDIVLVPFGLEVKYTTGDNWRSVANSIFESTRAEGIEHVYVLFGKMGGEPELRWGKYGESVVHVRTSHVPRFEVEIGTERSLFSQLEISYEEFCQLPVAERMSHIRLYARSRLRPGEQLWWLEDSPDAEHSLPIQARLYPSLNTDEKRRLRAEAALLCPEVVAPSRARGKYNRAGLYILTYYGVMCPQLRDLFSAGSVALRADSERGGNYVQRSLHDIQDEMRIAALKVRDELVEEYWGESVAPPDRIMSWLKRADEQAGDWIPSKTLFRQEQRKTSPPGNGGQT